MQPNMHVGKHAGSRQLQQHKQHIAFITLVVPVAYHSSNHCMLGRLVLHNRPTGHQHHSDVYDLVVFSCMAPLLAAFFPQDLVSACLTDPNAFG